MTIATTTWHRLEPRVRGQDPREGLRAAVHDPLWLLGRQWQLGELLGEDAAFPVSVRVETVEHPLARWRAEAGEPEDYDPEALPLEVLVEREPPVAATLRQRLDAWTRLVELLENAGLGARTDDAELTLAAPEYLGGRLDWFDLDVDEDAAHALGAQVVERPSSTTFLLPTRVAFPGMPAERFWELEDAAVDLGAVSASAEDLGRLLAVEFATVFGNDWWSVPVPARFGSLVSVRSLVVRDTFGDNVLVEPTERAAAGAPWRMFRLTDGALASGSGPAPPLLLLAPVVAGALEGEPLEDVLLLRDEMANLAWAVERVVEGADGRPRNRSIDYASRLTAAPPPALASPADLVYVLQTTVPEHWIPLVPVRDPEGTAAVVLQRGSLLTQDGTARPITAHGILLAPEVSPWILHEEEVPRAGLRVRRVPALARWLDGSPYAWVSRRVGAGAGEGSSGLQFDLAVPPTPAG